MVGAPRHKKTLFSLEERCAITAEEAHRVTSRAEIVVKPFSNLLMHFAEEVGAQVIVRGLRAVADFEYEFQMAGMNARLNPKVETVFLMASDRHQFISSRFVKEIGRELTPGKAALIVLARRATPDKVIEEMKQFGLSS